MQNSNKKIKKKLKNGTSGITLIALVVTIVVLIILAVVSLNLIFSENGIIARAKQASDLHKIAEYQEEIDQALVAAKMICLEEKRPNDVLQETKRILQESDRFKEATLSEITNNQFTVTTKEGYVFKVTENGVTQVKDGTTENSNLTVKTSVSKENYSEEYGCVYSDTISLSTTAGYTDAWEYWIKEKADLATKERMGCNLYTLSGSNLLQILSQLKENNLTLSQYCEAQGSTLDDTLYGTIKQSDDKINLKSWYIANMEQSQEESRIIEYWNRTQTSLPVENIDQVASYALQTQTTVEGLATEYNCSTNIVIDYMFLNIVYADNTEYNNDQAEIFAKVQELGDEYDENKGNTDNIVIKLPNGTEKTGGSANYTVTENGTYTFYVINNGETTEYPIQRSDIGHQCNIGSDDNGHWYQCDGEMVEHSWDEGDDMFHYCQVCNYTMEHNYGFGSDTCGICGWKCTHSWGENNTTYSDNGNGTHTRTWECFRCQMMISGEPEQHWGDESIKSYDDNGDGTHTINYTCIGCGADFDGYTENHVDGGAGSYVSNGDGTHTYDSTCYCGAEYYGDTQSCYDDDGDGNCDVCMEPMP